MCRPQRIGVFGHRGVGKTTLLTMLYREAAGGRLPGLRLAAADARTAGYLSDKIQQLEAGQALPATLGETELRFHLYAGTDRIELVILDYQGEHVELGRTEPVRDFLLKCDAVWLCLDAPIASESTTRWRSEQEVEQVVEDYLARERAGEPHRPMALVVTKSDLLPHKPEAQASGSYKPNAQARDLHKPDAQARDSEFVRPEETPSLALRACEDPSLALWACEDSSLTLRACEEPTPVHPVAIEQQLGMTLHALDTHCPWHEVFAISSLGPSGQLQPSGLEGPLGWLLRTLKQQDEARLEQLWKIAPGDLELLDRATKNFARRYPDSPSAKAFQRRFSSQRWRLRTRQVLAASAALLALWVGLWTYDALGERSVRRFARENPGDPAAVREAWRTYQTWHPTRGIIRPAARRAEAEEVAELDHVLRELRQQERLTALRRAADDPDADPEVVWADFLSFRGDFPEYDLDGEGRTLRTRLKIASDRRKAAKEQQIRAKREEAGRLALRDLERAEQSATLTGLVDQSTRLAREHAGTTVEAEILRRRGGIPPPDR